MKILIANSRKWFKCDYEIKSNHDIKLIENKKELNLELIKTFNPELIFFPHWIWKVPKEIFETFACIVFHTSPLPFGRGGSPIQNLILRGYKNSPVCAIKMVEELDAGPIYLKKEINLEGDLNVILSNLNDLVNIMMKELIEKLPIPSRQIGEPFLFKRLDKSDNIIPENISIMHLYDRVRMLDDETYPNAFIEFGDLIFEFKNAKKLPDNKLIVKF